ncbi:ABC transporter permease [Pseudoalteromonas denitrificans]|uniref:ABC transporter permease n=1 Tax=Pseudoalteromonas denitrificans TaxID=43656 RepID=UPI000B80D6B2|nr:FtsX-like permease family protein [Pseudoalteromonas denitrificans]
MWVKLAFRLFFRELKRGELTIITAAIALAVLTVLTLSSVTDRIGQSIEQKSNTFIAADRKLGSAHPLPDEYKTKSKEYLLKTADQIFFDTMLFANDNLQLSSVKAVSKEYPLRGELIIKDDLTEQANDYAVKTGPTPGNIWLSESVLYALDIKIGDKVELGAMNLIAQKVLVEEPDAPFNIFSASRRVLINIEDVPATQVIQPGSRVYYAMLFAGDEDNIVSYYKWLKPKLSENQSWWGVKDKQSWLSGSVNRAEKFLLLAGLLGIMLAAVAIAVSAKRYCENQYDPVAMMKTLGGSRSNVRKIFVLHLSLVTIFAIAIGLLFGFALQLIAVDYLSQSMDQALPEASIRPWFIAIATGATCALMFSLKPLLDLFDIPPLRVLRRSLGDSIAVSKLHLLLSALTIFSLMLLFSGQWMISSILFLSSAALVGILYGISRLLFKAGRGIGLSPGSSWSLAIASLQKRASANSVQLVSFALAIKLLLFLLVLKNDIINDWQSQLPVDAPNAFLVNVTHEQLDPIENMLSAKGISTTGFYPTVRGRLNAVNDELLARDYSEQDNEKKDEEAKSGIGRELNLTWLTEVPSQNEITQGKWFDTGVTGEASVEEGLAERLELKIGDSIEILIGSERFNAKVTSFRKVNWSSLKPNFFIILSPDLLSSFPATYISALHVPKESKKSLNVLLKTYPTITMIDVDSFIKQIRSTISQVSIAIGFVLVIVMFCGGLVLISQVQASLQERMQEVVILRTLGAKGRLIKLATLYEFFLLGLIAGLVAAIFSDIALLLVQQHMFELAGKLHPMIWLVGPLIGAGFVSSLGYFMIAKTLKKNTSDLLRVLS